MSGRVAASSLYMAYADERTALPPREAVLRVWKARTSPMLSVWKDWIESVSHHEASARPCPQSLLSNVGRENFAMVVM